MISEVDSGLREVACVAHHFEEQAGVETEEGVARHLSEETKEDSYQESTAHTRCADHVQPVLFLDLSFKLDG